MCVKRTLEVTNAFVCCRQSADGQRPRNGQKIVSLNQRRRSKIQQFFIPINAPVRYSTALHYPQELFQADAYDNLQVLAVVPR